LDALTTIGTDYRKWVGHSIDATDASQFDFGHPLLLAHPFFTLFTSGSIAFQIGMGDIRNSWWRLSCVKISRYSILSR